MCNQEKCTNVANENENRLLKSGKDTYYSFKGKVS